MTVDHTSDKKVNVDDSPVNAFLIHFNLRFPYFITFSTHRQLCRLRKCVRLACNCQAPQSVIKLNDRRNGTAN